MEGCRVWLDLSALCNPPHKHCCIYIDYRKEETVSEVIKHVCRVLGLLEDTVSLFNEGWFLVQTESSRVFREDDIISVAPSSLNSVEARSKRNLEEESCTLVSIKKRIKAHSSAKLPESVEPMGTTTLACDPLDSSGLESLSAIEVSDVACEEKKRRRTRTRRRKTSAANKHNKASDTVPKNSESLACALEIKPSIAPHSKSLASSENKHVFFPDDIEEIDAPGRTIPNIMLRSNGIESKHCNTPVFSNKSAVNLNSAGELSKLMSFGDSQHTPIFEHRRESLPATAQTSGNEGVSSNKSITLKEMPIKDSLIKFKVLKLSNYSPEFSRYITAKVISTDSTNSQLYLHIMEGLEELCEEKGKFSLDIDETETASVVSNSVFLNWNEILEPMLL